MSEKSPEKMLAIVKGLAGGRAIIKAVGVTHDGSISWVALKSPADYDLRLQFEMDAQCCEILFFERIHNNYEFAGAELLGWDYSAGQYDAVIPDDDADNAGEEYGTQAESGFLNIRTSLGVLTLCAYNQNNGYYSGFTFSVELLVNPHVTVGGMIGGE